MYTLIKTGHGEERARDEHSIISRINFFSFRRHGASRKGENGKQREGERFSYGRSLRRAKEASKNELDDWLRNMLRGRVV